ncbi:glycosyltransferase [Cytobacillus sp. FJAT-53684]|uniref:Glycosyltransferase n=1 Tax=Cytobacillus mangrovibacter TaxID=3299024 RepID=A0ABW6JW93_9BACI
MNPKLKTLILIKPFWRNMAKHKPKFGVLKQFEEYSDVVYWHQNGEIKTILKMLEEKNGFIPDFILYYDLNLAPKIKGLGEITIPKGLYIIDLNESRITLLKHFINNNKIDLLFSVTKQRFHAVFPDFKEKFRWLPWSVDQEVFKDWKKEKDIKFLLMGLLHYGPESRVAKGIYSFREEVLRKMGNVDGFVFHTHPGHFVGYRHNAMVNEKYAQEINRAEIFFTCGSRYKYPVIKFFEVLACKTLLLAESNQDIVDLGFKDKDNFIACTKEDFMDLAAYYSENQFEREKIANEGLNLIHNFHTDEIRAKELFEYILDFLGSNRIVN